MIRILHYGMSSNLGGIESYLIKIYRNIDREKYQFDFVDMTDSNICFHDEIKQMGGKIYKITPRSQNYFKNRRELRMLFEKNKYEIIHLHLNTLSYIDPIFIALRKKMKVIVHSRSEWRRKSNLTEILHKINYFVLPRNKIKMLAVSKKAANSLFGNNCKVDVINNGIEIDKFRFNKENRIKIRQELNFKDNIVVGHIGSFSEAKNHIFLIKILKEMVKQNDKIKLLLVGEGVLMNKIKDEAKILGIENHVIYLGKRDDISELLSAMDVFIFPSLFEGFPNAVLEAVASGLRCFISDEITDEILIANKVEQISLNESPAYWASKIQECLKEEVRDNMYDILNELGFSIESEIYKIEKIYENLLK